MFLSGVTYRVGTILKVAELMAEGESATSVHELESRGVASYSKIAGKLSTLLAECAVGALEDACVDAKDVDTVLLVTESFSELLERDLGIGETLVRGVRSDVLRWLASVGVTDALLYCSTFGGSSNFLQAILLLEGLIRSGRSKNALVLCCDREPFGVSRFMQDAISLGADGTAACVISSEMREGPLCFLIENISTACFSGMHLHGELGQMILEMYRALKHAAADNYEATCTQPKDFRWLILGNYNRFTSEVFSKLLGIGVERCFLQNVSRLGHVPSCDALINLRDLSCFETLEYDSRVMMFVNGPVSCGVVSLRVR